MPAFSSCCYHFYRFRRFIQVAAAHGARGAIHFLVCLSSNSILRNEFGFGSWLAQIQGGSLKDRGMTPSSALAEEIREPYTIVPKDKVHEGSGDFSHRRWHDLG